MTFTPMHNVMKIYVCNLRMFVVSKSVCPWQAFPDKSNVCE
jgi:hypothetical protein